LCEGAGERELGRIQYIYNVMRRRFRAEICFGELKKGGVGSTLSFYCIIPTYNTGQVLVAGWYDLFI
jgi:hypothetical protein